MILFVCAFCYTRVENLLKAPVTSKSRICKLLQQKLKIGVESYKKNFTKVVNMMSLKLKNNLTAFSHALNFNIRFLYRN